MDEAENVGNNGVHNISLSSCLSEAASDEDGTEATVAEQPHTQDEPMDDTKDRLHTKENGDIVVKNSPYKIPRMKR